MFCSYIKVFLARKNVDDGGMVNDSDMQWGYAAAVDAFARTTRGTRVGRG